MKDEPVMMGDYSLFSVLALIFGIVFWPLGIVFGILALNEIKKHPGLNRKPFTIMLWCMT